MRLFTFVLMGFIILYGGIFQASSACAESKSQKIRRYVTKYCQMDLAILDDVYYAIDQLVGQRAFVSVEQDIFALLDALDNQINTNLGGCRRLSLRALAEEPWPFLKGERQISKSTKFNRLFSKVCNDQPRYNQQVSRHAQVVLAEIDRILKEEGKTQKTIKLLEIASRIQFYRLALDEQRAVAMTLCQRKDEGISQSELLRLTFTGLESALTIPELLIYYVSE